MMVYSSFTNIRLKKMYFSLIEKKMKLTLLLPVLTADLLFTIYLTLKGYSEHFSKHPDSFYI